LKAEDDAITVVETEGQFVIPREGVESLHYPPDHLPWTGGDPERGS